ncbi:hypothetical protein [Paenibacillus nuruki]|uniref:hypothetical protein n=1 Tax=Paenibacillus nuruki TaxID=1886670 RepID=UPI0028065536|nr:hypothetical protein [Paenibacillus nuruki]CAJ1315931.1 hypothetical protein AASFL403_11960 [Paenibacillus nuruki]
MDLLAAAALGKAAKAITESDKDIKSFISRDLSRFFMLHGTWNDTAISTLANATYKSLIRPFTSSKQITFSLNSMNNGIFTIYYSLDGVNFREVNITSTQANVVIGDVIVSKYLYERTVTGPVIAAFYKYVETNATGAIFGGITSLESVVV